MRLIVGSVGENMDELAQRITRYAAIVDEANKRTLGPIIVELMRSRTDIVEGYRRPSVLTGRVLHRAKARTDTIASL